MSTYLLLQATTSATTAGSKYGPLSGVVTAAGYIMSAVWALAFTFRGRARWEPSEIDVPSGPQKVAGLIAAIFLVVTFYWLRDQAHAGQLTRIAMIAGGSALAALLLYGFLISLFVFDKVIGIDPATGQEVKIKVIGGFSTAQARAQMKANFNLSIDDIFKGSGYSEALVWGRVSRAIFKQVFVLVYVGLTVSGVIGLASGGILIAQLA
jgi:hypothetical protein